MKKYFAIVFLYCTMFNCMGNCSLIPSSWRNEQSGDWIISFYEDCVIYDNQFWNYDSADSRQNDFYISNKNSKLKVHIDPLDGDCCSMTIGDKKTKYQLIDGIYLPDYPIKDSYLGIQDTHFRNNDSVSIIGWLKNMPQSEKFIDTQFPVMVYNILTNKKETYYAPLDSIGRFYLRVPLLNTCQAYLDWNRSAVTFPLEPNESYLLLIDFSNGSKLIMGKNTRLQNEVIATRDAFKGISSIFREMISDTLSEQKLKTFIKKAIQNEDSIIDNNLKKRPNLSQRWINYQKGHWLMDCAFHIGQTRFNSRPFRLAPSINHYVTNMYWNNLPTPYSGYYRSSMFLEDFLKSQLFDELHCDDFIEDMVRTRDLILTQEETETYKTFRKLDSQKRELVALEKRAPDAEKLIRQWKEAHKADYEFYEKLKEKYNVDSMLNCNKFFYLFNRYSRVLDSICYNQELKDICMTRLLYSDLGSSKEPLSERTLESLNKYIKNQTMLNLLLNRSEMYKKQENNKSKEISLTMLSDSLSDINDGSLLIKKIIEPYRGKFVILEIWGTWCRPCMDFLTEFQMLRESLKDFDIVFLYLANRSPERNWNKAIREHNVSGENVVHYNLPSAQQNAIEHYLNISGYPAFRLFDKSGELYLDNINPRNRAELKSILKKLEE